MRGGLGGGEYGEVGAGGRVRGSLEGGVRGGLGRGPSTVSADRTHLTTPFNWLNLTY